MLCVGRTRADHILPATPVCCWFLCIFSHQNVARPACLWIIIAVFALRRQSSSNRKAWHIYYLALPRESFTGPRFEPKRTRINFDPYFDISLLSSPLALAPVFSPFEKEKKQAEEAVASEHLGFPWEGRAHGLRWKDQAARHKLLGQQNRGLYDPFISPFSSLVATCRFWQLQPWSQKRTWLWLGGTAGWSSDSPWLCLGYTAFKLCFWSVRRIWERGSKHLVSMSKKKCDEINTIKGKKSCYLSKRHCVLFKGSVLGRRIKEIRLTMCWHFFVTSYGFPAVFHAILSILV